MGRREEAFHIEIVIHLPENAERAAALRKRIACVHARYALQYVEKLTCSPEQKERLMDAAADEVRKRGQRAPESG